MCGKIRLESFVLLLHGLELKDFAILVILQNLFLPIKYIIESTRCVVILGSILHIFSIWVKV